ncbi:MAG: hypothetical protein DMG36_26610 [Acidobacteria bacterium]|nr:MAG: hypothetical protein DMG36_26610 [Acidobacteriota bacterium]
MTKKIMLFALCSLLLASRFPANAQQPTKVPRIGYLTASSLSANAARIEAFRQGLRELGYLEGKNIVIEYRHAEGKFDRLPALAAELVRLKVDVIVTAGPTSTRPAKEATVTISIVMAFDNDPVGSPKISRVAVLGTSTTPGTAQELKEAELAAGAFGAKLQYLNVLDPKDIETAFRAAGKGRADAVLVLTSGVFNSQRKQIVELAVKNRLPAIYNAAEWVEGGGLMSYGVSVTDLYRRAATYVDKILKGAKPADLPVQQPTKFELVINLKTAKQIGVTIPPNVLARADKVIK